MIKKSIGWSITIIVVLIFILQLYPTPRNINPGAYNGTQLFDFRTFQFVDRLNNSDIVHMPSAGPEDIQIDKQGMIYTGLWNGSLLMINPKNNQIKTLAHCKGRILGLHLNPQQSKLAFVDLSAGIGVIDLITLNIEYYGTDIKNKSVNSLTYVGQNTIYVTMTGNIPMEVFHQQILYRTNEGIIYEIDLINNKTSLFFQGLSFPNGIDYHEESDSLIVNELTKYRTIRIPINNSHKQYSVIIDNLIGFPDNVKVMDDNTMWIGIPMMKNYLIDIIDHFTFIRRAMIMLGTTPMIFKSIGGLDYAGGVRINIGSGQIQEYLYGKWDPIKFVTTINQRNGMIVLGSSRNIIMAITYRDKLTQSQIIEGQL